MSDGARAVILAAGTSSRAGGEKLLMEFRGGVLIEAAIAAAQPWRPLVVAGNAVARYLRGRTDVELVYNGEPDLGMSHSLRLASRIAPPDTALIVLLGDKPLVTRTLIETVCKAAGNSGVAYPSRGERTRPSGLDLVARSPLHRRLTARRYAAFLAHASRCHASRDRDHRSRRIFRRGHRRAVSS